MKIILLVLVVLLMYLLPELFRDRRSGRYQYPDIKPRLPGSNRPMGMDDQPGPERGRSAGEPGFSEKEAVCLAADPEPVPLNLTGQPDNGQLNNNRELANFIIMSEIIQPPLAIRRNCRPGGRVYK